MSDPTRKEHIAQHVTCMITKDMLPLHFVKLNKGFLNPMELLEPVCKIIIAQVKKERTAAKINLINKDKSNLLAVSNITMSTNSRPLLQWRYRLRDWNILMDGTLSWLCS